MKLAVTGLAVVAIVAISYLLLDTDGPDTSPIEPASATAIVKIELPAGLSNTAKIGKSKFDANCAACHGVNAVGQNGIAPPLVHKIYEPSHHGDESFQRAVAMGTPSHHWKFGDMPPVEGLNRADVAEIVDYVRELQRANNIN
jgi:mono/diheme cytochrome c family protein